MSGVNLAAVITHCMQNGCIRASPRQWQVLNHIVTCRTVALGASLYRCERCQQRWLWYHSCRDRHCPQCQRDASREWSERQQAQLLPVPYFHLVFTLPHELNGWIEQHAGVIYRLLFQTCWRSLNGFGQGRLGGQLGMTAVLHTWGQQVTRHVHLHCLVPAGVLCCSGRWQHSQRRYLLPVKALSRRFRGLMVSALREACRHGLLPTCGAQEVSGMLSRLMSKPWVVYSKPALAYRTCLVTYLARYSHRIGLSNSRLTAVRAGQIGVVWKDYRQERLRTMWLRPEELVRRFLLHVLPKGFMRIRHYGYLANAVKGRRLPEIRAQLLADKDVLSEEKAVVQAPEPAGCMRCPECGDSHVQRLGEMYGHRSLPSLNSS